MIRPLVKGSLAGGTLLILWSMASWMFLPWHDAVIGKVAREDLFTAVLEESVPASGVYLYPNPGAEESVPGQGPLVFMSVKKGAVTGMGGALLISFLIQTGTAFLMTLLLLQAPALGLGGRVLFGALALGMGGLTVHGSQWNWFCFPGDYTLVALTDLVVSGALAGLAAHWALRRKPSVGKR